MTTPPEDQLVTIEETVAAQAAAELDAAVAAEGLTVAALAAAMPLIIVLIASSVPAAFAAGVALALEVSAKRAALLRRAARRARRVAQRLHVEARVREALAAEAAALRQADDDAARRAVMERAKTRVREVAASIMNEAAAAGSETVAHRTGASGLVWVAERDACLTCQALSGQTVEIGQRFSALLTFGDRPLKWRRFTGRPPRHPHCRCRVQPWHGEQSVTTSLIREARRSVVKGFSLPSESEPARLRAARRLLRRGAGLPRTVEAYGRASVTAGRFPRGRTVPTGRRPAA